MTSQKKPARVVEFSTDFSGSFDLNESSIRSAKINGAIFSFLLEHSSLSIKFQAPISESFNLFFPSIKNFLISPRNDESFEFPRIARAVETFFGMVTDVPD